MQFNKWVTLGFGALCLIAVAGVSNATHLYYMAAIMLALPGVSYLLGRTALSGVVFARRLPAMAWEGEEAEIVYTAANVSGAPRFFLSVQESLPDEVLTAEHEPHLFNVGPNETATVTHTIRCSRRGVFRTHSFQVSAIDPLGVFTFSRSVRDEGELIVYPQPRTLVPMPLDGSDRYGWHEFTTALHRGVSVDPDGVRPYVPGDPLRHIHWRQTARTGALTVIEFEEAQAANLNIVLDLQRGSEVGTGAETTLEYAVKLTASLAQQAILQGASVRLIVPDDARETAAGAGPVSLPTGRGEEHLYRILDALARAQATSSRPVSSLVSDQAGGAGQGATLLVITAHPDPALPDALRNYSASYGQAAVVYIDPFSFESRDRRILQAAADRFLEALGALPARLFILRRNPPGALDLETPGTVERGNPERVYASY